MKIGWFSDFAQANSGFATVARNIMSRLQGKGHEFLHLAIGFDANKLVDAVQNPALREQLYKQRGDHPWNISDTFFHSYPQEVPTYQLVGDDTIGGQYCLEDWVKRYKPDLLIILGDVWTTSHYPLCGGQSRSACPTIFYQPLDGLRLGDKLPKLRMYQPNEDPKFRLIPWEALIAAQENTVFYGEWAHDAVMKNLPEHIRPLVEERVSVIHHGVDLDIFQPMPQKICRRLLGFPEDAFVVGMVATNQSRKRWPEMCKTMGQFMRKHEDVYFLPWTLFHTPMDGWDFWSLIEEYLPPMRVLQDPKFQNGEPVPPEKVAMLYASMDAHVLWHAGEGCGLPHIEAQACGRPSLAVNYAGIEDYFSDDWCRIPWTHSVTGPGNCIERVYGDEAILLEKLETLYKDPDLRLELGAKGRDYAVKHWDWDDIADEWEALIQKVAKVGKREPLSLAKKVVEVATK